MIKVFISFLFLGSFIYGANCCTNGIAVSSVELETFNTEVHTTRGDACNVTIEPVLNGSSCEGDGIEVVFSRVGSSYTKDTYFCSPYYVTESWYNIENTRYEQVCDECPAGTILINGECVEKNVLDCKATHGFDWVTDTSSSSSSSCGAKVDGINYTNGVWHDADSVNNASVCCLLPIKPNYDCSLKGDGWTGVSASSPVDCSSKVDGVVYDSGSFESGSSISDTCCVHAINPDHNSTDSNQDHNHDHNHDHSDIIKAINDSSNQAHSDSLGANANANANANQAHSDSLGANANANANANQAHSDSLGANSNANANANQAHSDSFAVQTGLNTIGTSLGTLRTENMTNFNEVNSNLSDIKDSLSNDSSLSLEGLSNISDVFSNGAVSITSAFSSIVSYNLGVAPTFSESSSGCDYSLGISYGTFDFPVSDTLDEIRPYLSSLWSFLFIYISFLMYYKGFLIVVRFL